MADAVKPKKAGRKYPGRSRKISEQSRELDARDYDRAAKMLRSNGRFSVKATRERLEGALAICQMQPIIEIVKIAKDPEISAELRLKALTFLGGKMLPDLKSVDMQVEERHDVQIVVKSYAGSIPAADLARPIIAHEVTKAITEG